MLMNGRIISGEFDELMNEFSLHTVKHLTIESTINQSQLNNLYNYLKRNREDLDGQIITLNDQMPLRLSQEEVDLLIRDFENIRVMYH
jgi:hypothetical protein